MFERIMMIQGLRKQSILLSELIVELEQRPALDMESMQLTRERAHQVSTNLRKLRAIKNGYIARQTQGEDQ